MPWFANKKTDLPIPPPEPPPSAAARKAKEQGWLESIRAKRGDNGGGRTQGKKGGSRGTVTEDGRGGTVKGSPGWSGKKGRGFLGDLGISTTPPASPSTSGTASPTSRRLTKSPPVPRTPTQDMSEFGAQIYDPATSHATLMPPHRTPDPAERLAQQTQTLASRLQELATAHEDQLLSDEEYRVLRQGVFASAAGQNDNLLSPEPPRRAQRSSRFGGGLLVPSPHFASRDDLRTPKPSRPTSIRPSLRSTKSTASFFSNVFRRGSRTNLVDESQWEDGAPPPSPGVDSSYHERPPSALSFSTSRSRQSRDSTVTTRRSGLSSLNPFASQSVDGHGPPASSSVGTFSSTAGSPRSRSIRLRPEIHTSYSSSRSVRSSKSSGPAGSSSASIFSSLTDGSRSVARSSHPTTSVYSRSSRINDSADFPLPLSMHETEPTAAELRREISDLEYECSRLLETFREMERTVVAKYRSVPASNEAAAMGYANAELGQLPPLEGERDPDVPVRGRPISFLAPLPSAATLKALSANGPTLRKSKRRPTLLNDRTFRASENTAPSSPHADASWSPASLSSPRLAGALEGEPQQEAALKAEVEGILARRRAVEEKYAKRLEYLRAKLKGAMIRERLPR